MASLFIEVKDAAMAKLKYEVVGKSACPEGFVDRLWEDKRGKRREGVIYGSQFVEMWSALRC